jgi:hypothetical protein
VVPRASLDVCRRETNFPLLVIELRISTEQYGSKDEENEIRERSIN